MSLFTISSLLLEHRMNVVVKPKRFSAFAFCKIACFQASHYLPHISSVPTLCEQNQLVIESLLNFVAHRLCK